MASSGHLGIETDGLSRREIEELRRGLLPVYIAAQVGVVWAWGFYVAYRRVELWQLDVAALAIGLCSFAALAVRKSRHTLACWLSILGLLCAQNLVVAALRQELALAFGVLAIVISYTMLSTWQAFAAGALAWGAQAATWRLATGAPLPSDLAVGAGLLYLFTWGAVCIGGRPLRTSVQIALNGWSQLRSSLHETRARRAELLRAVRALDEASYRIQRMNNQLVVAREAAEAARASKVRFAAMVSHELRGPLNLILGFSRLLALSPESYDEHLPNAFRADIDAVYQNSRHLVSLLDDILDLSQVEVDRMPLVRDHVDLEEDIIKEMAGIVQPLAGRRNLYIRLELDGNLPAMLGDRTRLRQVLLNLLTNAVRFTEKGGITIRTVRTDEGAVVSVEDTGPGIPADELPKLFEEFHRLRALEEADVKGTGLGLAISKHIVELHGGRIWAESTQDVGTAFRFTLPWLPHAALRAPATDERDMIPPPAAQATCLVVHESPLVVRLLARHIAGYQIVGLSDAGHLPALVRDLHPKAIIAEQGLAEGISSRLAAEAFRVPVLSCEMQTSGAPGIDGALMYLIKPVAPEMVEAVMKRAQRDGETTVMLVDDDRDGVRLLERMLRSLPRPYRILKAYSGRQALEMMRNCVPHVVFLDLLMPGMDGEQVIAAMRKNSALREVPVVVVSAREVESAPPIQGMSLKLLPDSPLDLARGARLMKSILDSLEPPAPQASS